MSIKVDFDVNSSSVEYMLYQSGISKSSVKVQYRGKLVNFVMKFFLYLK